MKALARWLGVGLGLVILNSPLQAQEKVLSARTTQGFDATLEQVQDVLKQQGFSVAHIQKCDGGLHDMGYKTDNYKIVFFGRLEEVRALSKQYPDLVPLFPFKLAVYADGKDTVMSVLNPVELAPLLDTDPALQQQLKAWEKDFRAVLAAMKTTQVVQAN